MNLHERVLSVLGCRYVDDVLIDAPQVITHDMISSLNIHEVVHGVRNKNSSSTSSTSFSNHNHDDDGSIGPMEKHIRYQYAKEAGIYVEIPIVNDFNFSSIIERIQDNQATFTAKIKKKKQAEDDYYLQKYSGGGGGGVGGGHCSSGIVSVSSDENGSMIVKPSQ